MRASRSLPMVVLLVVPIVVFLTAGKSAAFVSGKKSPAQAATDSLHKATEKYNDGVEAMERGREQDRKGDSLSAYSYGATSVTEAEKEYREAANDFEEAVALNPKFVEAYSNLGFCFRKLNQFPESLLAYDKALAIDSLYAQAREYRGELFLAKGELDRASSELDVLRRIESPYADTLAQSIDSYRLKHVEQSAQRSSGK